MHHSKISYVHDVTHVTQIVIAIILGLLLLTATAVAAWNVNVMVKLDSQNEAPAVNEEEDVETVTISIDLEKGGAIDLDTAEGDVTIDTYEGKEVLLIVEKIPKSASNGRLSKPVNLHVTRLGKDVRITAVPYSDEFMEGFDISYRLMVPKTTTLRYVSNARDYDFSKITSVLLRVLSKEAANWIAR